MPQSFKAAVINQNQLHLSGIYNNNSELRWSVDGGVHKGDGLETVGLYINLYYELYYL